MKNTDTTSEFIRPPLRIKWYLWPLIFLAEKIAGKRLMLARLLAHAPRAALKSGIFESLAMKAKSPEEKRLFQLVRLRVSFQVVCPFCVDMNSVDLEKAKITESEIAALQQNA